MDGRHCGHAKRDRAKEVLGVSSEENVFRGIPNSFGRSVLQVRVRRTSDCGRKNLTLIKLGNSSPNMEFG